MAGKQTTIALGTRYGRLTPIERAGCDKHRHPLVECLCDCGNVTYPPAIKGSLHQPQAMDP